MSTAADAAATAVQTAELEHVVELEMKLLDPNMRSDREAVQNLLHEYFNEFAPSGLVYHRGNVELAPVEDSSAALTVEQLEAELLTPGVVLVTYRVHRSQRASWRSSLWLHTPDRGWLLRQRQTTPIRLDG
ncbi:DUF4440 domain-containing protein [Arsenicicoccus dermatophilus]|uniref:DUF4440 domain-containing protein n=1 Tax=Arsenicicoccus dermatophilus TaxID=1076331 RepID=UPI003916E400